MTRGNSPQDPWKRIQEAIGNVVKPQFERLLHTLLDVSEDPAKDLLDQGFAIMEQSEEPETTEEMMEYNNYFARLCLEHAVEMFEDQQRQDEVLMGRHGLAKLHQRWEQPYEAIDHAHELIKAARPDSLMAIAEAHLTIARTYMASTPPGENTHYKMVPAFSHAVAAVSAITRTLKDINLRLKEEHDFDLVEQYDQILGQRAEVRYWAAALAEELQDFGYARKMAQLAIDDCDELLKKFKPGDPQRDPIVELKETVQKFIADLKG